MSRFLQPAVDWLAMLADRRIPQMLVITMGVFGATCGVVFLLLPTAVVNPTWSFLLNGAPPVFWGICFLGVGAGLAVAGVIDHHKSAFLCFCETMIFLGFGVASLAAAITWGTFVVSIVCFTFGWVCVLGLAASMAPAVRDAVHHD